MANEATIQARTPESASPAVERVTRSRVADQDLSQLGFGRVFSDHMLLAEFADGRWSPARILPYGPLPLPPSITGLQYALTVFEGMKAHRAADGRLLLFRPRENARRLQRSAARLAMPLVPESLFLDGLRRLLQEDREWAPPHGTGALYIRPVQFSSDPSIGVRPAERFVFSIFTSPYAKYYAAPVDVLVNDRDVRAFPGGTGDVKSAGNYAGAMPADREAKEQGCQSVLWLDAQEHRYVEECGVMNVFAVFRDRILTPPLTGTILPGITRDSVITLLREMGHRVEETRFTIHDLLDAHDRGDLREFFGTGTAATVSSVRSIRYRDRQVQLPPIEPAGVGPLVRDRLVGLASGRDPDPYGWVEPA
jgi:branched-chain amino acid aminotransferase